MYQPPRRPRFQPIRHCLLIHLFQPPRLQRPEPQRQRLRRQLPSARPVPCHPRRPEPTHQRLRTRLQLHRPGQRRIHRQKQRPRLSRSPGLTRGRQHQQRPQLIPHHRPTARCQRPLLHLPGLQRIHQRKHRLFPRRPGLIQRHLPQPQPLPIRPRTLRPRQLH